MSRHQVEDRAGEPARGPLEIPHLPGQRAELREPRPAAPPRPAAGIPRRVEPEEARERGRPLLP